MKQSKYKNKKTMKKNQHKKYKHSRKNVARGWFRKTKVKTNEDWFEDEGDKLQKIMIHKLTTMEHNKMCSTNRKKNIFTTCEKPIAKIDNEIDQLIQKVIDKIKLEQRNMPNFDYALHLNIFVKQSNVQNKSNADFNKYQDDLQKTIFTSINPNYFKEVKKSISAKKTATMLSRISGLPTLTKKLSKSRSFKSNLHQGSKGRATMRIHFLKTICSDSGFCLTFGKEDKKIKEFFKGFTTFEYAVDPIKRIGKLSGNGFVNQITYERDGYKAYAVLKSSMKAHTDNLMYEYKVGQYINTLTKKFPCFVETYGLFKYNDIIAYYFMQEKETHSSKTIASLKSKIILIQSIDWAKACTESQYLCLLIQHFSGVITLYDFVKLNEKNILKLSNVILNIFFQIYIPLALLEDTFTHYDLHTNNVLLYPTPNGKFIKFNYNIPANLVAKYGLSSDKIEFYSPFIVKIIDYGRCYFKNGAEDGQTVYDQICATPKCNHPSFSSCGELYGFLWNAPLNPSWNSRLSASVNNNKYDLDLLSGFAPLIEPIMNIKIIYNRGRTIIPSDIQFALRRDTTNKIPVTNVIDFLQTICTYTTANPTTLTNARQLLGTLDITVSEDMVFTLSKNYDDEQRSNISNISKKFFTKLDESQAESKKARKEAWSRNIQEQENERIERREALSRIIQEQEQNEKQKEEQKEEQKPKKEPKEEQKEEQKKQTENERITQAIQKIKNQRNQERLSTISPFTSRRLQRDIKKRINDTKEDILSKSAKNKQFTIIDRTGNKEINRVVSKPLSTLEEVVSNTNELSS